MLHFLSIIINVTTIGSGRDFLNFLTPGRPTMDKSKKRKVSEENKMFNDTWADSFAFTADETVLPVCLICNEKLANNKKSNVARHFQNKHTAFAQKYPDGDESKRVISELMRKADQSKNYFMKWMKSTNSTTYASFLAAQEIVRHGKLLTDGEKIKESFIDFRTSIHGL